MKQLFETRKTFNFHYSGRSTDYICAPFVRGCVSQCQYCYVHRHLKDVRIANNIPQILEKLNDFVSILPEKTPNQCDEKYWTFDIGCQSDMSIDATYIDWRLIFDYFKNNEVKASFATKTVNERLLKYNPNKKIRIRFSLTPPLGLEKGTSPITKRILALNKFFDAGYECHINFSPIIIKNGMDKEYITLFNQIKQLVRQDVYKELKLECIFLTHSEKLHNDNLLLGLDESLLWNPTIQEVKTSHIPNEENVRYKHQLKQKAANWFTDLVKQELNLPIRYIF